MDLFEFICHIVLVDSIYLFASFVYDCESVMKDADNQHFALVDFHRAK